MGMTYDRTIVFFVTIFYLLLLPNHGTSGKELSMYRGSFALPNNALPAIEQ